MGRVFGQGLGTLRLQERARSIGGIVDVEPLTEELLEQLLDTPSLQRLDKLQGVGSPSLPEYLQALLDRKGLKRADVVRLAGLNPTFGYQIFVGTRHASRNKLLQLAFAMGLTVKESERLLKLAGHSPLYAKDRRDAVILFCLNKRMTLQQAEDCLYRFGEPTICQ